MLNRTQRINWRSTSHSVQHLQNSGEGTFLESASARRRGRRHPRLRRLQAKVGEGTKADRRVPCSASSAIGRTKQLHNKRKLREKKAMLCTKLPPKATPRGTVSDTAPLRTRLPGCGFFCHEHLRDRRRPCRSSPLLGSRWTIDTLQTVLPATSRRLSTHGRVAGFGCP